MNARLISLFLFVSLLAVVDPALAARKKPKASPPAVHQTVITAVEGNSITISEDKVAKTFTITQFTEIIVNGQKATAAQLKPGMTVTVTLGTDPTHASRIVASGKP